jgi:hypothetical protein
MKENWVGVLRLKKFGELYYRLSEKMFLEFPPVENFKIFLSPNFSLIKKLKFSEFSRFLQLDCDSSLCPAIFFMKAYSITFQTSIISYGSENEFAHSKQKSAENFLKMRSLRGGQENVRVARRDCHR